MGVAGAGYTLKLAADFCRSARIAGIDQPSAALCGV